jgi:hypothetical protein
MPYQVRRRRVNEFAAVHESEDGPSRHLPRCSDTSGVGREADIARPVVKRGGCTSCRIAYRRRPPKHLRQLGEVRRHAAGLVARVPLRPHLAGGRRAIRIRRSGNWKQPDPQTQIAIGSPVTSSGTTSGRLRPLPPTRRSADQQATMASRMSSIGSPWSRPAFSIVCNSGKDGASARRRSSRPRSDAL